MAERAVRIFVSSTFRDMHFDREVIVKQVFPELHRICADRGVEFTGIDLRTGVTAEQCDDGMTLNLCLQEVDRCRPYFLCLLGQRYGWCQRSNNSGDEKVQQSNDLLSKSFDTAISHNSQYSWINNYRDRSVTEVEIRHAVLNDPANASRALFFFRDPDYLEQLLKEGKISGEEKAFYEAENDEVAAKLQRLKLEISATGLPVHQYFHHQELKQLLPLLEAMIAKDFPEERTVDPLALEEREQRAFMDSRCRVYLGRQEYYDALDYYALTLSLSEQMHQHQQAHSESVDAIDVAATTARCDAMQHVFIVHGEPGSGKSSLVANWAAKLQQKQLHQHQYQQRGGSYADRIAYLHLHFVGSSTSSSDPSQMLYRLICELCHRFRLHRDIFSVPNEWEALVMLLPEILQDVSDELSKLNAPIVKAAASSPKAKKQQLQHPKMLIIIFDAINQLTDHEHSLDDGSWLPAVLPDWVRVVVSTANSKVVESLCGGPPLSRSSNFCGSYGNGYNSNISSAGGCGGGGDGVGSDLASGAVSSCPIPDAVAAIAPPLAQHLRGKRHLLVEALDDDRVHSIAVEYMRNFGKTLDEEQLCKLVACEHTKNPLFLRSVLEEVRLWGDFDNRQLHIERYLSCSTIQEMMGAILSRFEDDYNSPEHPQLVGNIMRALWCSRYGLSESELQGALGVPRMIFSGIYLTIQQSLTNRSGRLCFFHNFLRQTVEKKYLSERKDRLEAHRSLGLYFIGNKETYTQGRRRNIEEILWQLECSGQYAAQRCLLRLPTIASMLYDHRRIDLFKMWRVCTTAATATAAATASGASTPRSGSSGGSSNSSSGGSYAEAAVAYLAEAEDAFALFRYHNHATPPLSPPPSHRAVDGAELQSIQHIVEVEQALLRDLNLKELIMVMRKIADFLMTAAQFEGAKDILKKTSAMITSEEAFDAAIDTAAQEKSQCERNGCLLTMTSLPYADANHDLLALRIDGARLCLQLSQFPEGISLCEVALQRAKSENDSNLKAFFDVAAAVDHDDRHENQDVSPQNMEQQQMHQQQHQWRWNGDDVGEHHTRNGKRRFRMATAAVIAAHRLKISCSSSADNPRKRRRRSYPELLESVSDGVHSASVIADLHQIMAKLYSANGQFARAEELYKQVLQFHTLVHGDQSLRTADVLNDYAEHCLSQMKYNEAGENYEKVLTIKRRCLGPRSMSYMRTLRHVGMFHHGRGEYQKAKLYFESAQSVVEGVFGLSHPAVADVLNEKGFAVYMMGEQDSKALDEASALYQRALEIRLASFGEMHHSVAITMNHLANIWFARYENGEAGAGDTAEKWYRLAQFIKEQLLPADHPECLLARNNLANLWYVRGQYQRALDEHLEILRIRREKHVPLQVATSLKNCGLALCALRRYEEALRCHREALAIRSEGWEENHPKIAESLACVGDTLVASGQPQQAVEYYQRAAAAWDSNLRGGISPSSSKARELIARIGRGEPVQNKLYRFW